MPETFVLIAGAWHGGWAWRPVAQRLRAHGHRVLTPTLPGLADGADPTRPFEVWQQAFIGDAEEPIARLLHELLVPQPMQYFTDTVESLDPHLGVPVAYVLGNADIALPPGEFGWNRFADWLGVPAQLVPGSHEACFTQPDALAEALLKA
jgi:hypothetical protein